MFDVNRFSEILNDINKQYDNMTEFAKVAGFDRTYISKYIHQKLSNPPTPKILMGIANASKGITTYEELMQICGYTLAINFNNPIVNNNIAVITLFISENRNLKPYNDLWIEKSTLQSGCTYFGYKATDESMAPLLGVNDIAIVEKTDTFEDNNTCLIALDNNIIIRKILNMKTHIELQAINYNFDTIKLTKEDMKKRNFVILGKVVQAKSKSAFE